MTRQEIVDPRWYDLCDQYGVRVNRSGFASCPFHEGDREPSMKVYPNNSFYCFACQKSGTVFDFVMRMEGVGFRRAFEILGGTAEKPTARARIRRYHARKGEQSRKRKAEEAKRAMYESSAMIHTVREALKLYEPLSDEWSIAAKDLSYYEGVGDMHAERWSRMKKDGI